MRADVILITGLQQSMLSNRIYITDKGAQAIGVNTTYDYLRARVTDATDKKVDIVLSTIKEMDDCGVSDVKNYYRHVRSNENTPVYAVGFIVLVMIILSVATVLFVIRLLLKTVFIKKEREFRHKEGCRLYEHSASLPAVAVPHADNYNSSCFGFGTGLSSSESAVHTYTRAATAYEMQICCSGRL